jgi:hypothetical protein
MNNTPLTILTLPIWWYTTGLALFWKWFTKKFWFHLHTTGLLAFARHWKEPLYGDYTNSGKVVGFFLRIIVIAYKAVNMSFRILILSALFIVYLLALPFVLVIIFYQIFGMYA